MIDLSLDKYAHLDSPIHRWDARFKLIGLMTIIIAFSFIQELRLLPALLGITLVLFFLSRLPVDYLGERLKYPGVFLLAVAIVLPLFSGSTVLLQLGPFALRQEGLQEFALILVKFVCILTVGIVLFGSAPFLTNIKAMRALRLSPILADIMLLTYRYVFEIGHDLGRMQTAMRMRNFEARRFSRRGLSTLAALSGTLLIRSYERSERVYKAMILRGYGHQDAGETAVASPFSATRSDGLALALALAVSIALIGAEFMLRRG